MVLSVADGIRQIIKRMDGLTPILYWQFHAIMCISYQYILHNIIFSLGIMVGLIVAIYVYAFILQQKYKKNVKSTIKHLLF